MPYRRQTLSARKKKNAMSKRGQRQDDERKAISIMHACLGLMTDWGLNSLTSIYTEVQSKVVTLQQQRWSRAEKDCFCSAALLLKRERGASPLLSRSCEPPLMSGVNNRATGLRPSIGFQSAIGEDFPGRRSQPGGESEDLPKLSFASIAVMARLVG